MTSIKKKLLQFCDNDDLLIVICTASVFLPFYLCYAAILLTFLNAIFRSTTRTSTICSKSICNNTDCKRIALQTFTPPHSKWFYAFALLTVAVGAIYRHWLGIAAFGLLLLLFLFSFYIQSMMTEKLCHDIIQIVACGSVVAVIIAIAQKITDTSYRSVSLFVNANYYSYICEILIIALVYATYRYGFKPLYFVAIVANIVGIFTSGCRSAWLAIFFGAIIVMICLKKYLHLVILSLVGVLSVIVIFLLPKLLFPRFGTFTSDKDLRFLIWKTAFGYIKSHPLFGQGMITYYLISTGRPHDTHAHNLLLDLLVNFGIIGTVLIAVLAVLVLRDLIRRLRVNPACAVALGVAAVTFVHGFTDVPFVGAQTGPMLLIVVSLAGICGIYPLHETAEHREKISSCPDKTSDEPSSK